MSSFLENLKNAVEAGEFNSEAAKKINEINEVVEKIKNKSQEELQKSIDKRIEESGIKEINKDELPELQNEYDLKMAEFRKEDSEIKLLSEILNLDSSIEKLLVELKLKISEFDEVYLVENNEDETNILISEIKSKYFNN